MYAAGLTTQAQTSMIRTKGISLRDISILMQREGESVALKKGLTANLIVDNAVEIAEEIGLENLTMQGLAGRLHVKAASLYNHISGIEEIRCAVTRIAMQQLESTLRDAAVGRSSREALQEAAFAYYRFAKQKPQLYKTFIRSAALENAEIDETRKGVVWTVWQILCSYNYEQDELLHFIRTFRSMLHGFISLEAEGFFKYPVAAEESFFAMVANFIDSVERRRG